MHFPASAEITDLLLARGEDINSRDRYECAPIHARVWARCLDQIPLLIARGGDINARDTSDQTALFGVVERFPVADVSRMMSWGADPLVVADSRVYGKVTLVESVVAWHNFLDTPRARGHSAAPVRWGARRRACADRAAVDGSDALHVHHAWSAGDGVSNGVRRGIGCVVGAVCPVQGGAARGEACACRGGGRLAFNADAMRKRVFSRLWDQLVPDSGQCQTLAGRGHSYRWEGRLRVLRQRWHQLGSFF
mgnify:CR=1 FL=1